MFSRPVGELNDVMGSSLIQGPPADASSVSLSMHASPCYDSLLDVLLAR